MEPEFASRKDPFTPNPHGSREMPCSADLICVVNIATITYYEVNLPLTTCSQHTQYFLRLEDEPPMLTVNPMEIIF